jgi:hypothetical protein
MKFHFGSGRKASKKSFGSLSSIYLERRKRVPIMQCLCLGKSMWVGGSNSEEIIDALYYVCKWNWSILFWTLLKKSDSLKKHVAISSAQAHHE